MPLTPTPPEAPGAGPLGIICGGGAFPLAVAEGARRRGRAVVLFPLRGFADADLSGWPHVWIPFAKVGRLIAELRGHGCRDIVFIGTLLRPRLRELRVDWQTLRALPRVLKLFRGGDDHLLSGLGRLFEEQGFRVLGAHEAAPEILVPTGLLGRHAPSAAQRADAARGAAALHTLGPLDIGQGVVVVNGHIVAVEAAEGTDLMLARVAELRRLGRIAAPPGTGVFVKLAKAGQDRRFDLPSLGPRTVEGAAKAGLAGLAVEAGGVIVTDLPGLVRGADAAGLFVMGIEAGNG